MMVERGKVIRPPSPIDQFLADATRDDKVSSPSTRNMLISRYANRDFSVIGYDTPVTYNRDKLVQPVMLFIYNRKSTRSKRVGQLPSQVLHASRIDERLDTSLLVGASLALSYRRSFPAEEEACCRAFTGCSVRPLCLCLYRVLEVLIPLGQSVSSSHSNYLYRNWRSYIKKYVALAGHSIFKIECILSGSWFPRLSSCPACDHPFQGPLAHARNPNTAFVPLQRLRQWLSRWLTMRQWPVILHHEWSHFVWQLFTFRTCCLLYVSCHFYGFKSSFKACFMYDLRSLFVVYFVLLCKLIGVFGSFLKEACKPLI
ncbi:PREDICTED: uncharacterized protein LOC104706150 isoform X1 [Camelina sativa]|uniref:Uncharacterized protein LOC104706150 isoform X1 n=1 Tax=Camelina sativa TaxID=90675 RepID=A0ABM0T433_CAMSA|nr:PREDICTED: uncharacterized protein LOC104706150 isoform X1 [Camelina sativa]